MDGPVCGERVREPTLLKLFSRSAFSIRGGGVRGGGFLRELYRGLTNKTLLLRLDFLRVPTFFIPNLRIMPFNILIKNYKILKNL